MKKAVVICGPSGVGKGTVISFILEKRPDLFQKRISHTSRDPRPGEIDGVSYHFRTEEQIVQLRDSGEMIETAFVHKKLYGTSFSSVIQILESGKFCIIEIDIQGAKTIKSSGKVDAIYIFINPPDMEELERRLRGRQSESEEQIALRIQDALEEMEFERSNPEFFDKIFILFHDRKTYA